MLDDDDGPVADDPLQQLAGLLALLGAHAGDGLVEEHHLGVLHEQHADLEPLLLPVGEDPGGAVGQRGQADGLQRLLDALGHLAAGRAAAASALRCMPAGDVEVLQHAELLEHRRGLEGPADAQAHDLVRLHRRAGCWSRNSRSAGAVHQPGEGVDQGGLAGAVRADEEVQPPLQEGEVDAVDRLEAVEVDGQVADLQVVLAEERRGHADHLRLGADRGRTSGDRRGHQPLQLRPQRGDAAGEEQHDHDEQRALEVGPLGRELLRERGLPVADGDGAQRRAEQRGPAAQGDTGDQHDRGRRVDVGGRDDAGDRDEHRPADAGHDGRHHERHQLDVGGVVAEEADALLGVAGGDQQLAEPAPVELPDDHQADDQQAGGDQVEVLLDRPGRTGSGRRTW